ETRGDAMRTRGILFLLIASASAAGVGLVVASRPGAMADVPVAKVAPKYEYGQLSPVYSRARQSTVSWTWEGPGETVNAASAAAMFEKLAKEKKDARKMDILNWLGGQGWVLVAAQKETYTEGKDERVLTQYLLRRP